MSDVTTERDQEGSRSGDDQGRERRPQKDGGRGDGDEQRLSLGGRRVLSASPLIWVLLVGAVAWAVWAMVTRGNSSSSGAGMRAVLVPTAGADRMVVALPCSALGGSSGGSSGSGSSGSGAGVTGGTSVVLLSGSGLRVVLVPGCAGGGGSSAGGSSGSSGGGGGGGSSAGAVLVLAPGTPAPKPGSRPPTPGGSSGGSGGKVTSVFKAPPSARMIVATPCQGKGGGSSQSAGGTAAPSGRGVLVTPPCGGGSG